MYRRARLGLGYLPQESSIFKGLSVEKNIKKQIYLSSRKEVIDLLLFSFTVNNKIKISKIMRASI